MRAAVAENWLQKEVRLRNERKAVTVPHTAKLDVEKLKGTRPIITLDKAGKLYKVTGERPAKD